MIEVKHLRKTYDHIVAVDDATFEAAPGAIFGLLGRLDAEGRTPPLSFLRRIVSS